MPQSIVHAHCHFIIYTKIIIREGALAGFDTR